MKLKKQIEVIRDEVKGLHPILYRVFSQMPRVIRVHHTHGIDEMGADFVLERYDEDLEQIEKIGVVVKSGSIKQDHSDVVRQINECSVRRLLEGEEVWLSGIWVVCNGRISRNAQEKLLNDYRDKNIRFFSVDAVTKWVERFLDGNLNEMPVALQDYSEALKAELNQAETAGELVPGLSKVFVEPVVNRLAEDSAGFLKKEEKLHSIQQVCAFALSNRLCLLEGRMGGGKSKVLRQIVRQLLDASSFKDGELLPIAMSAERFMRILNATADPLRELAPEGLEIKQDQKVVFIVDGLDEARFDPEEISDFLEALPALLEDYQNFSVMLSSRPVERFLPDEESALRSFSRLDLEPLRGKRAIDFLTQVAHASSISERIIADLSKSGLVRAFDSTPIAYILLGSLLQSQSRDLPATIPDLFERYFEVILGKWEIEKGLLHQQESQVMFYGLERIAHRMFEASTPMLARSEVEDILNEYLSARDIDGVDVESVLDKLINRALVLYFDRDTSTLGFRHRSFYEYFLAKCLYHKAGFRFDENAFRYDLATATYFYLGLLKDCPEVLDELSNMDLSEKALEFSRLIHFGDMLQAAYMSPSESRKLALKKLMKDAALLYWEIVENKVSTPLNGLSRIHLLGFFRNIVIEAYGYFDFCKHAEDIVTELLGAEHSKENALSIFFLVLIKAEHDGNLNFAELIDDFGESLPIEIKLGIAHEEDLRFKKLTKASKKMAKNLKSSLKNNPNARKFIDDLYNTPIARK